MYDEYQGALEYMAPIMTNGPIIARRQQHRTATSTIYIRWKPPELNWIKINMDVASKGNARPAGAGIICRNCEGNLLKAMAAPLGITISIQAETWGLLLATRIATQH